MKYFAFIFVAIAVVPRSPMVEITRLAVAPKAEKYLNDMVMMVRTRKNDAFPRNCLFCAMILR